MDTLTVRIKGRLECFLDDVSSVDWLARGYHVDGGLAEDAPERAGYEFAVRLPLAKSPEEESAREDVPRTEKVLVVPRTDWLRRLRRAVEDYMRDKEATEQDGDSELVRTASLLVGSMTAVQPAADCLWLQFAPYAPEVQTLPTYQELLGGVSAGHDPEWYLELYRQARKRRENAPIEKDTSRVDVFWRIVADFREKLHELGYPEVAEQVEPTESGEPLELKLSRKRPGAKPDPKYDEAYQEHKKGRTLDDVFDWYCGKTDTEHPDKNFRDSFMKAMKRRRDKET